MPCVFLFVLTVMLFSHAALSVSAFGKSGVNHAGQFSWAF